MKLGNHGVEHIAPSDDPEAWVPIVDEISTGVLQVPARQDHGSHVRCRAIVRARVPNVSELHEIDDLARVLRRRIETFVRTYKQNQDVEVTFAGWFDREHALEVLRRDVKRANKRPPK